MNKELPIYPKSEYTPCNEFWQAFATDYWEKESLAVSYPLMRIPITPDDLFEVVIHYCASEALSNKVRFGHNSTPVTREDCIRLNYYPTKQDGSFLGYSKRLNSIMGNDEYILVIDGFELTQGLKEWSMNFLKEMYVATGAPLSQGHFYSLFFGNYSITPFGVHEHNSQVECEGAFYFPLKGKKSMRLWNHETVMKNPQLANAKNYDEFLDDSTLITANAEGLLYWPTDRWHIGASSSEDVAIPLAMSTGIDIIEALGASIDSIVKVTTGEEKLQLTKKIKLHIKNRLYSLTQGKKRISDRKLKSFSFDATDLLKSAKSLPPELLLAQNHYRGIYDNIVIERASSKLWLSALSGLGIIQDITPRKLPKLDDTNQIRLLKSHKLLMREDSEGGVIIGFGGFSILKIEAPIYGVKFLIEQLNSCKTLNVGTLITNSAEQEDRLQQECKAFLLTILNMLNSFSLLYTE